MKKRIIENKYGFILLIVSIICLITSLIPFKVWFILFTIALSLIALVLLIIDRFKHKDNINLLSIFLNLIALINGICYLVFVLWV